VAGAGLEGFGGNFGGLLLLGGSFRAIILLGQKSKNEDSG
jgi:hypothetical protein